MVNGAVVTAYSRTQATPALSSAEAELYAIGSGTCEAMLVKTILEEMPKGPEASIEFESDSQAAISSQVRPGLGRMKHIELRHMFMQQMIKEGKVKVNA